MEKKVVIGLEVHIELDLASKLFCRCKNNQTDLANTNICSFCTASPHVQPVLNLNAALMGLKTALLLNCEISEISSFDKKQYFYPDLPKGFQTTQYFNPLAKNGCYSYFLKGQPKSIFIKQIHLEEDAAKLIHQGNDTQIDFNRSGVALLEVVTEPQFNNSFEVDAFLNMFIEDLRRNNISRAQMENGNIRVDVNISIDSNSRTEIKNLNSLKSIRDCISLEIERQSQLIKSSKEIAPVVLKYDDKENRLSIMRAKESAIEYKYIPEPDILPIKVNLSIVPRLRETLKIIYNDIRYLLNYGVAYKDAYNLACDLDLMRVFVESVNLLDNITSIKNFLLQDTKKILNELDLKASNLNGNAVVYLISNQNISQQTKRQALKEVLLNNVEPKKYIEDNDLRLIDNETILNDYIDCALANNTKIDLINNFEKSERYIIGQVNELSKFKADIKVVIRLLQERKTL